MASTFSRTLRSLAADEARRPVGWIGLGGLLFVGWLAWFSLARVAVYELTPSARLEVGRAVHHVEAQVTGRVVTSRLALGREVRAGEVLVELDVRTERLELEEEQARLASIGPQREATTRQLEAERRQALARRETARVSVSEARARAREADVLARLGEEEARRTDRMHALGQVAELDALRARAEAQRRRAAAEALTLEVRRLERQDRSDEAQRLAEEARLEGEAARLQGEAATLEASVALRRHQLTRRAIVAPTSGRIGRVTELRPGSMVREGDRLADVVPTGDLRVVAQFPVQAALGRIRPGQPASVRLEGFPWAQYGTVPARVVTVGTEAVEGRVRVELEVLRAPRARIPMEHGLQGSVEVQVERVSPAALVLRAAGRLVSGEPEGA